MSNEQSELRDKIILLPCDAMDTTYSNASTAIFALGAHIAYGVDTPGFVNTYSKDQATHEYVPRDKAPTTSLPKITEDHLEGQVAAARTKLMSHLSESAKTAYVPTMTQASNQNSESRYFGAPWMPDEMKWPEREDQPMQFVMQLRTESLPGNWSSRLPKGLLLFFIAEEYSDDQSEVVIVDYNQPGSVRATPEGVAQSPALAISGWQETLDYPWGDSWNNVQGHEDFEDLMSLASGNNWEEVISDTGEIFNSEKKVIDAKIKTLGHCFSCDKLGGWPHWAQGDETPLGKDGVPMEYVMQIGYKGLLLDQEVAKNIKWPTWGTGHIFISPKTKELKYVWASS